MAGQQLTAFEHILLGRICVAPASGYDLKRMFAATPMGVYQPSSGALYPALRRLELKGMVRAQAPPAGPGLSARRRRILEPTQAGLAVHVSWLRTPIETATVARDLGQHLVRFVTMEHLLPRSEVLRFLHDLADALAALIEEMERFITAADFSDRHQLLAIGHGLAVRRTSLEWAQQAIEALSAAPAPSDVHATA